MDIWDFNQSDVDHIIGELISEERFTYADKKLIADVVRSTVEKLKEVDCE